MRTAHSLVALILAFPLFGEKLPIQLYTTADGLANNHVSRIRTDSRGFLWFCTDEGLSRFDGHSFTNYTIREGLPHPWVNDLLETRDGAYWVATDAGVSRYNPAGKRFRVYRPSERPGAARVNSLLEDRSGVIWVGTYDGLYRMSRISGISRLIPAPDADSSPPLILISAVRVMGGRLPRLISSRALLATRAGTSRRWLTGQSSRSYCSLNFTM